MPIIMPLLIAQVHANSSAHTILCGFESGRPTPYFVKAFVSAEYPANVHRISTQRTRICTRGVRRDVRHNFRAIATQHPHSVRTIAMQFPSDFHAVAKQ